MSEVFNDLEAAIFAVWVNAKSLEDSGLWRRVYQIREIVISPQTHNDLIDYFYSTNHYAFQRGEDGDPTYKIYGIRCRIGEPSYRRPFDIEVQPKYTLKGTLNKSE